MGGVSGTPWSPPLPPGPPAGPLAPPGPPTLPAPRAPPAAATPPAPSPPARPPAPSLLSLLLLLLALQSVLLAYLLLRRHASVLREYKRVLLAYLASGKAWRCLHCTPPPDHDATRPADAGAAAGAAAPPHAQQLAPQAGLLAALRHRCAPCLARLPCLAPLARAPSAPAGARGTPAEQAPPRAVPRSPPTRASVTVPVTTSAAGDSGRTPLLPPRTVRSDAELGPPSSGARSRASTPQQALVDVELQLRRLKLNQTLRLLSC